MYVVRKRWREFKHNAPGKNIYLQPGAVKLVLCGHSLDAPELHASVTSENQFHCTRLYTIFKHSDGALLTSYKLFHARAILREVTLFNFLQMLKRSTTVGH